MPTDLTRASQTVDTTLLKIIRFTKEARKMIKTHEMALRAINETNFYKQFIYTVYVILEQKRKSLFVISSSKLYLLHYYGSKSKFLFARN